MTVDWTKPIQLANGDPCELVETNPDGWKYFGARADGCYPTRRIHLLGFDETTQGGAMAACWYVHEDGKTDWPQSLGFDVVNKL